MRQWRIAHGNIVADTVRIGALTTLVKVAGAAKTIVIAHYFGKGDLLDAYLIAFLIPSFVGDILASAITQSLLPILVEVRETDGAEAAHRLYGTVLWNAITVASITAVIAAIFWNPLLRTMAQGFGPAKIALTRALLFVLLPLVPLSAVNVIWRTLLNAQDRFAMAALAPLATPLTIILFVLAAARHFGAYALALGTLCGGILEIVILAMAVSASGMRLSSRWHAATSPARRVLAQYVPVASSSLMMGASSVVDQMMAASLGSGSVSALTYGTRLSTVVLAIGPAALGTALLPRLSRLTAGHKLPDFIRLIRQYSLLGIAATVPLTVILVCLSEPLVRLFYQRGAFTAADTRSVAVVQAFSLLQIPFSVLLVLLVRAVSSLKQNQILIPLAILSLIANVGFNLLLMRWYGVAGIALSTTVVHAGALAFVALMMFRSIRRSGLVR
jgi:putative peptidoglycan lipid II flippase